MQQEKNTFWGLKASKDGAQEDYMYFESLSIYHAIIKIIICTGQIMHLISFIFSYPTFYL